MTRQFGNSFCIVCILKDCLHCAKPTNIELFLNVFYLLLSFKDSSRSIPTAGTHQDPQTEGLQLPERNQRNRCCQDERIGWQRGFDTQQQPSPGQPQVVTSQRPTPLCLVDGGLLVPVAGTSRDCHLFCVSFSPVNENAAPSSVGAWYAPRTLPTLTHTYIHTFCTHIYTHVAIM